MIRSSSNGQGDRARPSPPVQLHRSMIAVVVGGTALTLIAAIGSAMPGHELAQLIALACGTAAVGAAAALVLVTFAKRRSFVALAAAAAAAALVPVVVGVWAAGRWMILDEHDLGALMVVLSAAGTVALITALVVGRRIGRASDALVDATRRLGDGEALDGEVSDGAPEGLARLRRELELTSARLEQARERERALERSRRELVAWVSHDLRTPLAGIKALAEALEDGVADDRATVARYQREIGVEADRLGCLVDDLFELSRAQAGVLRLEFERVSLGDLVSDAIAAATPIASAKGVNLEGRLAAGRLELSASSPEVLRALRNVVENAIRHTPADGTVMIQAGLADERAYVSVVDDGGGIPEPDLPRVFDVAFRGDVARTPGDGAGLGLAIARGLIEAHRGEITVQNHNGGACFTIRLPLDPVGAA